MGDARRAAEAAARVSYGRLVALLAARTRDIAAAEDALSAAFVAALAKWPERGIPANPDAWLLTTARNAMIDDHRRSRVRDAASADLEDHFAALAKQPGEFPDERLKLLFACAHPAIDAGVRTPLMMQVVLGIDASRIAAAFLVPPATMGQRLVRAKAKIRDARIGFSVPQHDDMPARLGEVLDAIYAAFGQAWDTIIADDPGALALSEEAIFLARILVSLLPEEPEAKGLLALMLYCEARREARRSPGGAFVPLDEQEPGRWSRVLIIEAETLLTDASRARRFGRYQTEAAIQSVHLHRVFSGSTNYRALHQLYTLLTEHHPGLGAMIGFAGVKLKLGDAGGALALLDALPADRVADHQPFWVMRAHILTALEDRDARTAADRAIALTRDDASRAHLLRSLAPAR